MKSGAAQTRWLYVIIGIAAVLRTGLALQGGQYFFGDEGRFMRGVLLYRGVITGQWDLISHAVTSPQHAGFIYIGALVCPLANACAWLLGSGDWSQATNVHAAMPFIAGSLGLFSILNVWLVYQIVRRHGGDTEEALLAAFLAAINSALAYQARHLLPYDSAATALLGALALMARADRPLKQTAIGGLAALSFCIYNGFWFVVPALGLLLLYLTPTFATRLRAGAWFSVGVIGGIALAHGPGALIAGPIYGHELLRFSGTAYQGLFSEGWSFPWEYYWQAESWLGLIVLGTCAWVLVTRRAELPTRVRTWLVLGLGIYLLLTLTSNGLHKFVVYGRSVRPLFFVLCLLGGYAGRQLLPAACGARGAVLAGLLGLAAINLAPHFRISYPNDVQETVWAEYGFPKLALSYQGIVVPDVWPKVDRPDLALTNAVGLYPLLRAVTPPAGDTLAEWRHPFGLPVYMYEGHRPWERRLLRATPPVMRLIKLSDPDHTPNIPAREYFLMAEDVPRGY